jgi:CDP-glucose 4,6-dehydratase
MEGVALNPAFWEGKRVLLTGHTGFKGSWLSLWLQTKGAEVVGYALAPPTNPSLFEVAKVGTGMTSLTGDIRDLENLKGVITEYRPEIVFHMAAQPLVRYSYIEPVETYATNVMGTVNLLEAVRTVDSTKVVVAITSDKCYENREWVWGYRENEPMGGYDPYSSSKGCSELVIAAYRNSYFHPESFKNHNVALASARAGNVIGGGDWSEDRLIPDIMRAITEGKPVNIRNPHAIRPWQHVLDPLHGYLLLAQKLYEKGSSYAEAWNFGPNDEDTKPVQWLVEKLTEAWGKGASWVKDQRISPHEANFLKLDCSKAKARLNWHPRLHLADALNQIIDWYRAFQDGEKMREFTLRQIKDFSNYIDKN